MIGRLERADREQRKMLLSIFANFLTRIPGVVGLIWFLPLLHQGLGTENYAALLSGIALANAACFLCSGLSIVGRRTIGAAYAKADRLGEANGFMSLVTSNALGTCIALIVVLIYCLVFHTGIGFAVAATMALISLFLGTCSDMVAAYNKNYVTAILLILFQTTFYMAGFLVPATRESVVIAAALLVGPYLLAHLCTVGLLLWERKYLLGGRDLTVLPMLCQGIQLALAEGLIMATLSLSVVWVATATDANTSAWFATVVRLFQTALVPIALVLLPLSGYIRMYWDDKSLSQQRRYFKATLLLGLSYGALVAGALFVGARLYVGIFLHLPVPRDVMIFVLFAAIVAYKSYASIAYVVLDRTTHLASLTTAAVGAALVIGAAAGLTVDPLTAIDLYGAVASCAIVVILMWNARFFVQEAVVVGKRAVSP